MPKKVACTDNAVWEYVSMGVLAMVVIFSLVPVHPDSRDLAVNMM